jgi:hypothetical protein
LLARFQRRLRQRCAEARSGTGDDPGLRLAHVTTVGVQARLKSSPACPNVDREGTSEAKTVSADRLSSDQLAPALVLELATSGDGSCSACASAA